MADQPSRGSETRATITIDGDGWFQAVSPTILQLIDQSIEHLSGLNLVDLVHPRDAAQARELLTSVNAPAAGSSREAQGQLRLFCAGDTWRLADVVARGVGDGRIILDVTVEAATSDVAASPTESNKVEADKVEADKVEADKVEADKVESAATAHLATSPRAGVVVDPEVPKLRAAAREGLGGPATPMIEIDLDGRTVFVSGPWGDLTDQDLTGADALEFLLSESEHGGAIGAAIETVLETGQSDTFEVEAFDHSKLFVHVRPIPSPVQPAVVHALIGVSPQADFAGAALPQRHLPSPVAASSVSPADLAALPADLASAAGGSQAVTTSRAEASASAGEDQPTVATGGKPFGSGLPGLSEARDWLASRGLSVGQLSAVAGLLVFAMVLRTWDLSELPNGFHGDEAITGVEAQLVLENGSIGVYTGSALGQPTGPFYIHAIGVALFGPTIWGTRIVAAMAGLLTVAAVYSIVQRRFDHRTGLACGAVMAMMTWSIHFSRIAFGVAWWPLAVLLAIAAIDRATTDITWRNWAIAGAWSTFGIYVYNSHAGFGIAVVGFMALWLAAQVARAKRLDIGRLAPILGGLGGAFIVALPMISYANGDNGFSNHFTQVRRTNETVTPEWADFGFFEKVSTVFGWYLDTWNELLLDPVVDGGDASGVIKQIPLVVAVLAVLGMIESFRRYRTAFMGMVIATLVVMPLLPALTLNGNTRRAFAMAPSVAILAGIGAVALYSFVADKAGNRSATYLAVGLSVVMFFTSVVPYFTTFRNDQQHGWVFVEELTAMVDAVDIASEDAPVFVNFFSARHNYGYETIAYLLKDVPGATRTPLPDGFVTDPTLELTDGVELDQLYVFIGDYANQLEKLEGMYPDGKLIYEQDNPRMVAYEVPAR